MFTFFEHQTCWDWRGTKKGAKNKEARGTYKSVSVTQARIQTIPIEHEMRKNTFLERDIDQQLGIPKTVKNDDTCRKDHFTLNGLVESHLFGPQCPSISMIQFRFYSRLVLDWYTPQNNSSNSLACWTSCANHWGNTTLNDARSLQSLQSDFNEHVEVFGRQHTQSGHVKSLCSFFFFFYMHFLPQIFTFKTFLSRLFHVFSQPLMLASLHFEAAQPPSNCSQHGIW